MIDPAVFGVLGVTAAGTLGPILWGRRPLRRPEPAQAAQAATSTAPAPLPRVVDVPHDVDRTFWTMVALDRVAEQCRADEDAAFWRTVSGVRP